MQLGNWGVAHGWLGLAVAGIKVSGIAYARALKRFPYRPFGRFGPGSYIHVHGLEVASPGVKETPQPLTYCWEWTKNLNHCSYVQLLVFVPCNFNSLLHSLPATSKKTPRGLAARYTSVLDLAVSAVPCFGCTPAKVCRATSFGV